MAGLIFVDRKSDLRTIEGNTKNKFKWSWLEEKDTNGDFLSDYVRKLPQPGIVYCLFCKQNLNYSTKGKSFITRHAQSIHHISRRNDNKSNQSLPAAFQTVTMLEEGSTTTSVSSTSHPYGVAPNVDTGTHVNAKATLDLLTKSFSNALRRKRNRSGSGADSEREWNFKEMTFPKPPKQLRPSSGNLPNVEQELHLSCDHIDSQDITESQTVACELDIAVEEDNPTDLVTSPPQDSHTSTSESQRQTPKSRRKETRGVNKHRGEEIHRDAEILNLLKQRDAEKSKESPRLNFFRSIMETVDSLDQYQFMNFQMDVIQALKKQKQKVDQPRIKDEQPIQYAHSQSLGASTSTDTYYTYYTPDNSEYYHQ